MTKGKRAISGIPQRSKTGLRSSGKADYYTSKLLNPGRAEVLFSGSAHALGGHAFRFDRPT
jgi:hypothetical protein